MSNYFGISSDSVSTLFSGLQSSSSSSGSSSILGTYSQIRSGSYYKLMKSYYEKQDKTSSDATSESTSTSKDTTKKLMSIQNVADDLKESAETLMAQGTGSIFAKKNVTDASGNTTYGYDKDSIFKAVNQFVSDYNTTVSATKDAKGVSVLTPAASLVTSSQKNQKLLQEIGITIASDNTMKIDETAFKKADMSTVKSLFQGAGSYGYSAESKAFSISTAAKAEAAKSNTYTNKGSYSYNHTSAFDDLI